MEKLLVDIGNDKNYLREARRWDEDRIAYQKKLFKYSIFFTIIFALTTISAVIGIVILGNNKTVVPFLIKVDNATGIVEPVTRLSGIYTPQEAISRYFVVRYVLARENYSKFDITAAAETLRTMSSENTYRELAKTLNFRSENSPYKLYGETGKASIAIKSIVFRGSIASIRYRKDAIYSNGQENHSHWLATLEFKYTGMPLSESDRLINPLGFVVTNYRNDPEIVSEEK